MFNKFATQAGASTGQRKTRGRSKQARMRGLQGLMSAQRSKAAPMAQRKKRRKAPVAQGKRASASRSGGASKKAASVVGGLLR